MAKHIGIVAMSYEGCRALLPSHLCGGGPLMASISIPRLPCTLSLSASTCRLSRKLDWEETAELLLQSVNKVTLAG